MTSSKAKLIVVCTPTLKDNDLGCHYARSMFNMLWPINTGKALIFKIGMPVAEARNACVQHALSLESDQCELDSIFWLDNDVVPQPEVILQLYSRRRPIVSGVYFTKDRVGPQPLILPGKSAGTDEFIPDRFYEVFGHGMGLTLVKAQVYKDLVVKGELGVDGNGCHAWYRTTFGQINPMSGENVDAGGTEDTYFLDKVQSVLGIGSWIDTTRHAFGWHRDKVSGECFPLEQWQQCVKGEPIVWDTSKGKFAWNRA